MAKLQELRTSRFSRKTHSSEEKQMEGIRHIQLILVPFVAISFALRQGHVTCRNLTPTGPLCCST